MKHKFIYVLVIVFGFFINIYSLSANEDIADQYPNSALYSKPLEFFPYVFSAIGATAPPSYENSGHNNNLSFIITGDGVVVINSGAAFTLAKALHEEIKLVTDQPVKLVINENAQGLKQSMDIPNAYLWCFDGALFHHKVCTSAPHLRHSLENKHH